MNERRNRITTEPRRTLERDERSGENRLAQHSGRPNTLLSARLQLIYYRAAVAAQQKAKFADTDFAANGESTLNTPMFYCTE